MMKFMKKLWKKLVDKIKFEYKMLQIDSVWTVTGAKVSEPYPPSFFYRNPPEKVAKVREELRKSRLKDYEETRELLNAYRREQGLPEKDYRKDWIEQHAVMRNAEKEEEINEKNS